MFKLISRRFWNSNLFALSLLAPLVLFASPVLYAGQSPFPKIGTFFTTYYYVPNEKDYPAMENAVLENMKGEVLSDVNATFKKDIDIEGTGILREGKTVNYAGRVDDQIRYRFSPVKWGWGVGQCPLKPYHTIAVDPNIIPLGTVVYIPAAKGAVLPDGSVHDGVFYAEDIGSAILHHHIDLFTTDGKDSDLPFQKVGINTGTFVDVYKLKDPDPNGCQTKPPVNLNPRVMRYAASEASALTALADEYAALGEKPELKITLAKIQDLKRQYGLEGGEPADAGLVLHLIGIERQKIKDEITRFENSPFDMIAGSGYAREYNGTTLSPGEVVLSFDDGPSPRYSPLIHQTLKEGGAKATFFEVGEMVEAHPELTRAYAQEGWIIGNHSYNHPDLVKLSDADVADQINRTQKIIQTAMGGPEGFNDYFQKFFAPLFDYPRTLYAPEFFRSPYGSRSARTMQIITSTVSGTSEINGKTVPNTFYHIMWDIDSLDWQDHSPQSICDRVFAQLAANNHRGLILMHDIHPQSAEAFQLILPRLKSEGYKIISMYDMIAEAQAKAQKAVGAGPKP